MLEDGMQRFLAAITEARQFLPSPFSTPRRTYLTTKAVFSDHKGYEYAQVEVPMSNMAVTEFYAIARYQGIALPALSECADWHVKNNFMKSHREAEGTAVLSVETINAANIELFVMTLFTSWVEDAFDQANGGVPTDEHYRAAYQGQFARWHGAVTGRYIVPIHGIALPDEAVKVSICDGMDLVSLTANEKNAGWYWILRDSTGTNPGHIDSCRTALIFEVTRERTIDPHDIATKFLTALRLVPIENFRAPDSFYQPLSRSTLIASGGPIPDFSPIPRGFSRIAAVISSDQIADAMASYHMLSKLAEGASRRLDTSLSRFRTSFVRDRREDALLDLVIALEALLLPASKESELAYRFRVNAVLLLPAESPSKDRLLALNVFEQLYSARSAVVHKGCSVDDCVKTIRKKTGFENWHSFYAHALGLTILVIKSVVRLLLQGSTLEEIQARLVLVATGIERS